MYIFICKAICQLSASFRKKVKIIWSGKSLGDKFWGSRVSSITSSSKIAVAFIMLIQNYLCTVVWLLIIYKWHNTLHLSFDIQYFKQQWTGSLVRIGRGIFSLVRGFFGTFLWEPCHCFIPNIPPGTLVTLSRLGESSKRPGIANDWRGGGDSGHY